MGDPWEILGRGVTDIALKLFKMFRGEEVSFGEMPGQILCFLLTDIAVPALSVGLPGIVHNGC